MNSKDRNVITNAINNVTNYLDDLSKDSDIKKNDKAVKLAYWLSDYIRFLRFEERFDIRKSHKYKRGDIIKVHLGFNIGSEEGGLHYAVVIDNASDSPVLTIIPLTSIKPGKDINNLHQNEVYCGSAIYNSLDAKITATSEKIRNDILNIGKEIGNLEAQNKQDSITIDIRNRLDNAMIEAKRLEQMQQEIAKMKNGSIALINQITTVSKIRIYNPKNRHDVLYGIEMPEDIMDIIDDKIKHFYTKEEKKSEKVLT